jgi:heme/copper-type cytochrome/quinol oxidase subunit 2
MIFKKSLTRRKTIKRRSTPKKKRSRFLELAIVAITALVVIYVISFAIRVTHGFSRTHDTPEHVIRLQVLNGCGVDGAAGQVATALSRSIKMPIELSVVEVADFDSYHVEKSFLISRESNTRAAAALAERLGLATDPIVYRPIENNYRSINVTLVLGDDFRTTVIEPSKSEN